MTQVRFQCQDCLPTTVGMQKFHPFIETLGMKLMATYYARKLGSVFEFPQISSPNMDNCHPFLEMDCDGWDHGGLYNLYSESFSWTDPLAEIIRDDYDDCYDEDEEEYVEREMPSLSDFICAAFCTSGNEEDKIAPYSPKKEECNDTEDDEMDTDPYSLVDDLCENGWNILYDRFCRKKPIAYPDDKLGNLIEKGMNAVSEIVGCNGGTEDFQHRVAFSWLMLMNNMFFGEEEEDPFYAALVSSHPKGEAIRKECAERKGEAFYGMASEIIEACLAQIVRVIITMLPPMHLIAV